MTKRCGLKLSSRERRPIIAAVTALGLSAELADLLGPTRPARAAGHRPASRHGSPQGLERDVDRAVYRCAGLGEDACDPERLVGMVGERHVADAMADPIGSPIA